MVMGAGKVAEIPAGVAGSAVSDQGLGAIWPGRGFAQKKLRHFAHLCGFAARLMPDPKAEISGEPFGGVFHLARQFAGSRKGGTRFRRLMSLGPDQRIAEACLEVKSLLAQRGGVLHRIAFRERRKKGLRVGEFGELLGRREALDRWRQHGVRIGIAIGRAIKLRQRQCGAQFEAARFLRLRDGDRGLQ